MAKTPDALVAVAESQLGYDRYKDPEQGTKYGRWYAELTGSPWFGTNGVPFCMMGASWCCAQIQVKCFGLPTAACTYVMRDARAAGKLIKAADLRRGDLALFNWSGGGYWSDESDHVGIVTENCGTYIKTVEFNVDNGKVKRREREYKYVVGGIRPDFESQPAPQPSKLVVDGDFGTLTCKALQEALQSHGYYKDCIVDGYWGHYTKLALQQYLRNLGYYTTAYILDGWVGPATVKALQTYLRKLGYYGSDYIIDGDWGYWTTCALQKALNDSRF